VVLGRPEWPEGDTLYGSGIIIHHVVHFSSLWKHPQPFGLFCYVHCCIARQNILFEKA